MKDKAESAAHHASKEVKERASDFAENVATETGKYAGKAKDSAATEVKSVASALRTAASEMRSGSPQERTFSQIAESLADASDSMRDKDLGEMMGAVSNFAKRNPMVFLGSAALIGFAATRFAKASNDVPSASGNFSKDHGINRAPAADSSNISDAGSVRKPATTATPEGQRHEY